MGVLQVAGCALLAAAAILALREWHASLALPVRLAAAIVLFGAGVALIAPVLTRILAMLTETGAGTYAAPLCRAAGVALIAEFTAAFCRDLGESTVAEGVLFFGKAEILVLCLPLAQEVLGIAKELLQF